MTHIRAALPMPDSSDQAVGAAAPVIVVGLDGSPTSWDAFAWAAGEAVRAYGGLVVYVNLVVVGRSAKMLHHLAGSLDRRLVGRKDAPVVVVVP